MLVLHGSLFLSLMGATDMLSSPTFSVVIPCMILGKANGSSIILKSEWLWLSMKPGHRMLPPMSSTVRASGMSWAEPTATMRPSRTPTQPLRQGVPVPSTMRALVKSRSSMNVSPCQPSTMRRARVGRARMEPSGLNSALLPHPYIFSRASGIPYRGAPRRPA